MNILVIDDEVSIRRFVTRLLRAMGHTTDEAADLGQAEQKLRSGTERFDLVISDTVVVNANGNGTRRGWELAPLYQELGIPFIGMSGMDVDWQWDERGAIGFLHKPFRKKELDPLIEIIKK